MERENKALSVVKIIIIVILSFILLFNLYIIIQSKARPNSVPSIFGYKPFVVLSNSMEDEISAGDLVIVKETDMKDLHKDDIIAFRTSRDFVTTHRIVNTVVGENGRCFETKGDSNNVSDDEIICGNSIEGKYLYKIPYLGHIILFIQKPYGLAILLMAILILWLLIRDNKGKEMKKLEKLISKEEMKEYEEFKKAKEKEEIVKEQKEEVKIEKEPQPKKTQTKKTTTRKTTTKKKTTEKKATTPKKTATKKTN